MRLATLELPPWPYDTILDGTPLRLRPGQDGELVGHRLVQLDEPRGLFDNVGTTGMPYEVTITAKCEDNLKLRNGQMDAINTGRGLRAALRATAAKRGTVSWTTPSREVVAVSVHDIQERQTSLAPPAWDVALTLTLAAPVTG